MTHTSQFFCKLLLSINLFEVVVKDVWNIDDSPPQLKILQFKSNIQSMKIVN